jgi:hypothetical protein
MQTNRYTGKNLFIEFEGTIVSGEWTSFQFERTAKLVDVTAAGEQDRRQRATLTDGRWLLRIYDHGASGDVAASALAVGASGTLTFGPQGNDSGKPKYSFEGLVTKVGQPYTFDDAVVYEFAGVKNGPMLADHGDTF